MFACLHGFACLSSVALLLIAAPTWAQTVPSPAGRPGPTEPLPFVDATGRMRGPLHHSALVARLGEPPVAAVPDRGTERSGSLSLAYPDLGLVFVVESHHRAAADPIVDSMRLTPPWLHDGRSNRLPRSSPPREDAPPAPRWIVPGSGLHLGMSSQALDAQVAGRYRVVHDLRIDNGNGSLTLLDTQPGGRGVSIGVDNGRVSSIEFVTSDQAPFRDWQRLAGPVAMILLALTLGFGWQWGRRRMHEALEAEKQMAERLRELAARRTTGAMTQPAQQPATEPRGAGATAAAAATERSANSAKPSRTEVPRRSANWAMLGRGVNAVQDNSDQIRLVLGLVCLAIGAVTGWMAFSGWRDHDKIGMLLFGLIAFGAVVWALLIFSAMRNSILGKLATAILIAGLLAHLVFQFLL